MSNAFNPFSDAEFAMRFLAALDEMAQEPVLEFAVRIENGSSELPRASGIGSCARRQLYKLSGMAETDKRSAVDNWPAWMGWCGQEIVIEALKRMGYTHDMPELPANANISGHIDGVLSGLDLGDEAVVFDSKLRNVYGEKKLIMDGPDDEMYYQMQAYMTALDLERTLVLVLPHDLSTWRTEVKRNAKNFTMAEPLVQRVWVEADVGAQKIVEERARGLMAANALGLMVRREFNPARDSFPCDWCGFKTRCLADDLEVVDGNMMTITPLLRAVA